MTYFVTFGYFKIFNEEEKKTEKENFFIAKKCLLSTLLYEITDMTLLTENDISNMDKLIEIKKNDKNLDKDAIKLGYVVFMASFGLSYELLNQDEKNELSKIELNYENCQNLVFKIYNKYIDDSKENTPKELHFCFKDRSFVSFCHVFDHIIKKSNIVDLIKKYYFFDLGKDMYEEYRDNEIFMEVKNKLIKQYPTIKENYGSNRYLDIFLRCFDKYNDYNNPFLKDLLDNYYKIKNNNNNTNKEGNENTPLLIKFN